MTIKKRLYISFTLILSIIMFIIGVFFYATYNLNELHKSQNHRYDQIRRVEKLKEYNNSFSWLVLDIITDYDKSLVVKDRIEKANDLYKKLQHTKDTTISNSESKEEKKNLLLIFSYFKDAHTLITQELQKLIKNKPTGFQDFDKKYEKKRKEISKLLDEEIVYLQDKLDKTEIEKDEFIDTIKLELVVLLFISFLLSFIISSKITQEIKGMLHKLNKGVLQLFKDDENTIKVDLGEKNELSELTDNLNLYLEKQHDIIHSREELLRNISHELKTPITKGKFLIEKLNEKDKVTEDIKHVLHDIEELTSKLLQREKLNFATLNISKFKSSSLILESLSKLTIKDESMVSLNIEEDFDINADKYYLTIALKNLIDNALKYSHQYPINIDVKDRTIYVGNISDKLTNDLIYYTKPFTREPNQQKGHGLGLNIVNKIIELHDFKLDHTYKAPHNIFYIVF